VNAAGLGWFVDATPLDAAEFIETVPGRQFEARPHGPADGRVDLLTVLSHEFGHTLGLPDLDPAVYADSIMTATLTAGVRRVPSAADPVWAVPAAGPPQEGFAHACELDLPDHVLNGSFGVADPADAGYGWTTHGGASVAGGAGVLVEDARLTSGFSQSFVVPTDPRLLRFTFHTEGFAADPDSPPDAFEVALLHACTFAPVAGVADGLTLTDALLNVQSDGTTYYSPRATVQGVSGSGTVGNYGQARTVVIDLTGVPAGTPVTLYFDLLGFGTLTGKVVIDDVILLSGPQSPPTDITLGNSSVAENAAGATVGALTVTDPDAGDVHTFTVSDARFEVVGGVLKLKAGVSLDREAEPTVSLSITATDLAGLSLTREFVITVTNVNESPTALVLGGAAVAENAAGSTVGALTVTDPDVGDSHTFTVSDGRFEVVGGALKLKSGVSLDYEAEPTVSLSITATDAGGLSITRTFTITVTNVNEAPTSLVLDTATVAENAAGASIGVLAVTDPDAGDTHAFAVSDARFEVVGTALKLKAGVALDHEAEPTVGLSVTATDVGGLSITRAFVITVTNVNEAPAALTLGSATVAENAAGATVGTLTVNDPDVGDTHTLAVSDTRFEVVGGALKLKPGVSLDYEAESKVNLTITATDGGGLSVTQPFTITVTNVNETPTALTLSGATVPENAAGATIGTLAVTDPDVGDTHTFTVSDSRFEVAGATLRLKAGDSLNYEAEPSVYLTITATDAGGLSITRPFTVTVTNVNEAPAANAGGPYTVPEGGSVTLTGSGSDPDAGDGRTYAWDLDGNGTFETPGQNPTFSAAGLDGPGSRAVVLRVTDAGGLTSLSQATITLTNAAPSAGNDSAATDEDRPVAVAVLANDSDPAGALDPLRIESVANGTKGTAAIDTKGTPDTTDDEIVYTPNPGATGSDSFTYTISDGDGGTATATVAVQIRNLVDVSGRVFDDADNDGAYEPGDGDAGIGGVTVRLFDEASGSLIDTRTTAADGTYLFDANLGAGTYRVVAAQPAGFLDGRETAGNLGGAVDNAHDANQIGGISVGAPGTTADAADYQFAVIRPSQVAGLVWRDSDNDGQVDFGEAAVPGVTVVLTGLDDRGNAVSRSATTDANGVYAFTDLRPSGAAGYTIHESQPAGYADGLDSPGSVNGVAVGDGSVNDTFSAVVLPRPGSLAEDYNFGERPPAAGGVTSGQTATIGFWQNKNGQDLIKSLNGGPTSTQLGNWLAANFPNMYGVAAGANNLAGRTNAQVAAFYKTLFARTAHTAAGGGPAKVDAQVMATALAVYVTNQSLAGTTASAYGFQVSEAGVGTRTFDVGGSGAAFGVAANSQVGVLDLLLAVNSRSRNGLLYDLDGDGDATDAQETSYRTMANNVFSAINEAGDI
jgi:hypothetical protein